MIKHIVVFAALLIAAVALTPSAAMAQSYTGNWPVNVALPPHFAHTACLALVDTGTGGHHSGSASLSGPMAGSTTQTGTFQVINNLLVASFPTGSETGEVVYELFIALATDGDLGAGAFEEPGFLSGATTFGTKGGC
jgi:hypothetical protein